ncbi:hillarin isoform X2 [Folsomia candida]|uniref:hillarin isoform X2 n=1 Tax=Folsomia candida TaxID=158441 RepID=UPI00160546A6|nr:hillarin isoform X2 [Folsomia candida]
MVGPLKDFSFFHSGCFKCCVCGSRLSLRTYYHSQHDQEDKEVYCISHVPKPGPGHLDGSAVGIRSALNVPKSTTFVNEQIRASGKGTLDLESLHIRSNSRGENGSPAFDGAGPTSQANVTNKGTPGHNYGRFDASALHIAHALRATQIQKAYKKEKPLHTYLPKEEQTELEMKFRKEEDILYRKFEKARKEEEARIHAEFREEWERELDKLASKFESLRAQEDPHTINKLRARERDELERHMTIRRDKKREQITRKLLEHERAATAALVEKQSKEMLHLINERKREWFARGGGSDDEEGLSSELESFPYPQNPPPPSPPATRKTHIYTDPVEFTDIDQIAISVAQEDQKTFTDLVRKLVSRCGTDVEKARTIFRWITVKNLNAMDFSEDVRTDTPMGLLRGIKQGTESYHVLFKRLCSYAGLHCVVIKGLSKSAGYQPGVKFTDSRFRNSWNAVYVAGGWRFVQCNWGARHLVNAKERASKSDSLRYEYDDHYFLTDPKEFIFEFFPTTTEWQLLKRPITLAEFEELPFVRSLFFRYGLYFPQGQSCDGVTNSHGDVISHCKAVMTTDQSGAATVRIGMPPQMEGCLIFHYNLKSYDNESDTFDGVSLKRFVMQSVTPPVVSFRTHAPASGAFLLDVFANAVTPREYLTGEPMKFKSVCKVKIECGTLSTVMVPLPDCASGEWGPAKANRLFGLIPLTHPDPLIFSGREVAIDFSMSRPLTDFMATLHKNGTDEKKLAKFISQSVRNSEVSFSIQFPEEGQYGLDIYTREIDTADVPTTSNGKQLLTHCCKYLINSSKRNATPP